LKRLALFVSPEVEKAAAVHFARYSGAMPLPRLFAEPGEIGDA
jgi:hypothetical protein